MSFTVALTLDAGLSFAEVRLVGTALGGIGDAAWDPQHGAVLTPCIGDGAGAVEAPLPPGAGGGGGSGGGGSGGGGSGGAGGAGDKAPPQQPLPPQFTVTLPRLPGEGREFKLCGRRCAGGAWEWMGGANTSVPAAPPALAPLRLHWRRALEEEPGLGVVAGDAYLTDFAPALRARQALLARALGEIASLGGMDAFSRGYEVYGFTRGVQGGVGGIFYREWAPGAREASLVGDFNGWDERATPLSRDAYGVWSTFLPDAPATGLEAIPHDSYVRLSLLVEGSSARVNRLPAYIRYAVHDPALNQYVGKYWNPPAAQRHAWLHPRVASGAMDNYAGHPGYTPIGAAPQEQGSSGGGGSADPAASGLRIYESHVGLAGQEGKVSSYTEFRTNVLPRIVAQGYNCVQLMAVMEHAYYGSFGYHVTSFLAPSSRFGTPEELKALVDAAHGAGLLIIMDCVHSHACKNIVDGLNELDGTEYQYFHAGARGRHELWDSRLFDYSKTEVKRLLLSSLRLYAEEFRFDGFRFDGVTSMLYTHHGMGVGFSGGYHEYFGSSCDGDAACYLQLANTLLHSLQPPCLSIAEDVSGMPTLGRPVWEGGLGFDYRLAMAVPDVWIKLLKEKADEEWDVEALVWTLTNRRHQEKCIAYSESHDQALVGDKTIAFWLMDKEMYWHMSKSESPRHPVVDRGIALHKLIRLLTCALGGEGWLGFIGNEFGHPEWLDFPREGNGWSYHYCRRQWSLVDDPNLLYAGLALFEARMLALSAAFPWLLPSATTYVSTKSVGDKVVAFERGTAAGPLLFILNFNAERSFTDYRVGVPASAGGAAWAVALDSDWEEFGGYARNAREARFPTTGTPHNGRPNSILTYLPSRTALVLRLA